MNSSMKGWKRLLRPEGCLAILDGDWCTTPADRAASSSLDSTEVRELMDAEGFCAVQIDDLDDLCQALTVRALRENHPVPPFSRYLVWGRR